MPTNPELARRIRKLEDKIKAQNPRPGPVVGAASSEADTLPARAELARRIRELEDENDELQDRLDQVADLAAAPEDDECEAADDLKDALNEILEVAAPGEVEDEDDEDRGNA